jgi:asparagine synthase (glutamine-hydrolysing)
MCGITGFLDGNRTLGPDDLDALVARMAATLRHRGPDGTGTWVDADAGVALGHTRLSIIDLSPAGAQPMVSASGRYVITYNGEVYNAADLAPDLTARGVGFRGHSDTEVLLEAIEAWGLEATLERIDGMWAFALWDRETRRLHLVRDRLGIKPLYYGRCGPTFAFGSELKSLRAHPGCRPAIDRDAIARYLRFAYVPSPGSIYEGIHKLAPGTVLTVEPGATTDPAPVPYWSAFTTFEQSRADVPDDATLVEEAHELLRRAVKLRMVSDVPVGAFLSGGIDSSTVVALMQELSTEPVRTFTIGTTSRTHNEADVAHEVARVLGTRHTELVVTAEDARAVIPKLATIYDEPFADSSQIPTFLVSELARADVTVSLSGDGGDEVFGGYDRYRWLPRVVRRLERLPNRARAAAASGLLAVPPRMVDAAMRPLPSRYRPRIPSVKLAKLASILRLDAPSAMYAGLVTQWDDPLDVVIGAADAGTIVDRPEEWGQVGGLENLLMMLDTATYLPDDILTKLDRASMAVGLEGRVPLVDFHLVEWAAALPPRAKIREDQSKHLLRAVLRTYVPDSVIDRPKSGFGVPIGAWLRGPLKPWADDLLSPARLRAQGYLRPEPIERMWREHLTGRRDWEYHLWNVLVFQDWLEQQATPAQ